MNYQIARPHSRSLGRYILLFICLNIGLLSGCGRPDLTASAEVPRQQATSVLTPTLTEPDQAATISALRRTAITEEEAAVATALAQPLPTDGPPEPFPTPDFIIVQTGMDVCIDAYIGLLETNCWLDLVNGVYVHVVAGAREDDEAQGVLVVSSFTVRGEPLMDVTWYDTPSRLGAVGIRAVNNPHLQIVTEHDIPFAFNVATMSWENPTTFQTATPTSDVQQTPSSATMEPTPTATIESLPLPTGTAPAAATCELYPIALPAALLTTTTIGQIVSPVEGGSPGNFGWLSWIGVENIGDLLTSLTPPGTNDAYYNPFVAEDRTLSVGDVVWGRAGTPETQSMRDALDRLVGQTITVPVWDTVTGQGAKTLYHVSGFAQVQLMDYEGTPPSQLRFRYLGPQTCETGQ